MILSNKCKLKTASFSRLVTVRPISVDCSGVASANVSLWIAPGLPQQTAGLIHTETPSNRRIMLVYVCVCLIFSRSFTVSLSWLTVYESSQIVYAWWRRLWIQLSLKLVNFITLVFRYCSHQFLFACVFVIFLLQYVFAREAINIIKSHDPSTPLYLYLPYQAVHEPLQVGAAKLNEGQVFFLNSIGQVPPMLLYIFQSVLEHFLTNVCALHKDLFSDESSTALLHSTDLFSVLLMVSWQAPQRFVDMYANIKNQKRRIFSGESVLCFPSIFRPCFDPLSILCLFFFS